MPNARKSGLDRAARERVRRIRAAALAVWKSRTDANNFLTRPHMMLANKSPVSVANRSEKGAQRVLDILGGLEHGSAA